MHFSDTSKIGFGRFGMCLKFLPVTGVAWTVKYEADALPDASTPAWTLDNIPNPVAQITSGQLHFSGGSNLMSTYQLDYASITNLTVEYKAKYIAGTDLAHLTFTDGTPSYGQGRALYLYSYTDDGQYELYICTDGVYLVFVDSDWATYTVKSVSLDTSAYHLYRVLMTATNVKLYIDGTKQVDENFSNSNSPGASVQLITGGQVATPTEFYVDYIYFKTDEAVAP